MPIRPENRARYPANWKTEVVPRIRERSGNRCECTGQCGRVHNRRQELAPGDEAPRCERVNGQLIHNTKSRSGHYRVVLTVMHLNHTPEDCRDENLLHGCQGCHLRYDAPMKAAGIKERRLNKNGDAPTLFDKTDT